MNLEITIFVSLVQLLGMDFPLSYIFMLLKMLKERLEALLFDLPHLLLTTVLYCCRGRCIQRRLTNGAYTELID